MALSCRLKGGAILAFARERNRAPEQPVALGRLHVQLPGLAVGIGIEQAGEQ